MERCDKRTAILHAALELVAEHGFHGAPMALVAERAGVAAGTIYRYFDNKDILIRESYAHLEEKIWEATMDGYPTDGPIRERYLHICRSLAGYFISSPMEFRFIEQFHNSPYGLALRREKLFGNRSRGIVIDLLEEGRKQGIVKDLPLPILCGLTFGPLVHSCRDHILQLIRMDEGLIMHLADACWDAVRR